MLVEKASTGRESDQRSHGVHKGHDEDGERHRQRFRRERPRTSICAKIGAMLTGAPKIAEGHGATRLTKATSAVVTIPISIAPGTFRITSAEISRNPKMATSTGAAVSAPAFTGAPAPQLHDAGLVQSDEGEKQSDATAKL